MLNIPTIILFLLNIMFFSSTMAMEASSVAKEPVTVEIKINQGFLKRLREKQAAFSAVKTGYTPPKKKSRHFYTEWRPLIGMYSHIQTVQHGSINSLYCDETLEPEDDNQIECQANNQESSKTFNPICLDHGQFDSGQWCCVTPFLPESSVLIDCDDERWNSIVTDMIKEIKVENQEAFIASIMSLINKRNDELKSLVIYAGDEFCCRHTATMVLPIFSKIFNFAEIPFNGTIHLMSADLLNSDWVDAGDGHNWNVLRLFDDNKQLSTYWLVDCQNKVFVNLSENPYLKHLNVCIVNTDGSIIKEPLEVQHHCYNYVRLTKEVFKIGSVRKNPYGTKAAAIIARKMGVNYCHTLHADCVTFTSN